MGNFSQPPGAVLVENLAKGYIGTHIEQGVPVLDRDVNLLRDLLHTIMRNVFVEFLGDGVAAGGADGFQIQGESLTNDFRIGGPGTFLANGQAVRIAAPMLYSEQQGVAALTTPAADRQDAVYLDVWTNEVTGEDDSNLLNSGDVGMQTSVRIRLNWHVRVAEGSAPPAPDPDHSHHVLAELNRPTGEGAIPSAIVADRRQTRLNLAAIEQRLRTVENRLFAPTLGTPEFIPPAGGPGTEVRIFGTNFDVGGLRVLFGSTEATVTQVASTEIRAEAPALPPGPVLITVTTDGGSVTSQSSFLIQ